MRLQRTLGGAVCAFALLAVSCATPFRSVNPESAAGAASELPAYLAQGEWPYWGGSPHSTRYSPLRQIDLNNVDKLEIAWRWSADTSGSGESSNYKSTPLMIDGVLYTPWLDHGAAAIDAATGKTLWTFVPPAFTEGGRGASLAPRSLSYWSDGQARRLYHNSQDGRLLAIDASTGKPPPGFGDNGVVDLRKNITPGRDAPDVSSISPALVVGDVIVTQVIIGGSRNKESFPGTIRGYDVRTGELLWTFNPIPPTGEPGSETWENGSNDYTGAAGAWSMLSADPELGYVYIPHETPTNEFYGGHRLGDGLFGETLVALDARTGKRVWHFQIVHHGIWDYDMPTAPILHEVVKDGTRIKAVTQLTKQGLTFVFDRKTGEPVWPIEERPVPGSDIPGERPSPTQPFPTLPEPMLRLGYDESDLIDFTPELRAEGKAIADQYTKGPLYTTPTLITTTNKGTWLFPGTGGGPNWNGAAVDPATNIMYTPVRLKPQFAGLRKGDPKTTNMDYYGGGGGGPISGPRGLPILKPPYSELIATDMNTGRHLWRIPIGDADDFVKNHKDLQGLGLDFSSMGKFDVRPSPLLTPDLLFLGESGNIGGGSGGPMFRAYDKRDGRVVWEMEMPTLVTGAPMTYVVNGEQYIAVAISKRNEPAEIVALKLGDGVNDASVAVPSPAPQTPRRAAIAAVNATPEELVLGRAGYAQACAVCHGPNGAGITGGNAPALTQLSDTQRIAGVIRSGQGEMPSMAALLSPEQVSAVAKFVASGLPRAPAGRPQADEN
ncbi:PQQ-binding-like beta-propeller repeat protein [bacterium]|nr:PQQ-binding-like beta-propeller repeat protein [bacterium]